MKGKWQLFSSIFQLIIGTMAIIAFIVIAILGEDLTGWIVTLILAIAFVVLGTIGIINCKHK